MINEAIVLAGGKGTRLKQTIPELPKVMAPVAGKAFINYVIDYLRMQGVQNFIFALGYKAEIVTNYLKEHYPTLSYKVLVEDELLGTGGAIKNALAETTAENIIVTNGDTLFKANYKSLIEFHFTKKSSCTIVLKQVINTGRYGAVEIDDQGKIISFTQKQGCSPGLINSGIYILNKNSFLEKDLPDVFSFEKDYLEKNYNSDDFFGIIQEGYFIDIGIPHDYEKANKDLIRLAPELKLIDQSWSLFLDRDGVINKENIGKYILNWNDFHFSNGVMGALKILAQKFKRIVVVSNQRGVGKSLMSEQDLQAIHNEMLKEVELSAGRIDKIYYCTETSDKHPDRKPNPGMALKACLDFPEIDLEKSIMVGNKPSDMRFGRNAGMVTVFITSTNPDQPYPHPDIDFIFPSLQSFAQAI